MNRGDVYTAATGPGFGSKPRPVIVVQADAYTDAPVVMVAPLLDETHTVEDIRPVIEPDENNGLHKRSAVGITSLIAVRQAKFGRQLGRLSATDIERVDAALRLALGLT